MVQISEVIKVNEFFGLSGDVSCCRCRRCRRRRRRRRRCRRRHRCCRRRC